MAKAEIIKKPIEKISDSIKMSAWTSILESLAILVLGILFVVWPDTMINVVAYVVGIFFLVKGSFQIINYFIEQGQRDFFNNNLLAGTVSALVGIAALIAGPNIANVFRVVVGIFLIYDSLVRINSAVKLHAVGINAWSYVLIVALIIMVMGIIVCFSDTATIIGWIMIASGIISIVGDVIFIQYVGKLTDILTGKTSQDKTKSTSSASTSSDASNN